MPATDTGVDSLTAWQALMPGMLSIGLTGGSQLSALQSNLDRYNQILQGYSNLFEFAGRPVTHNMQQDLAFGRQLDTEVQNRYQDALNQLNSLFNSTQANYAKAQQDRYNRAFGLIGNLGQSRRRAIEEQYAQEKNKTLEELTARGLGNSTILGSVGAGFERQKQRSLEDLEESLRQTQLGLHTGLTGESLAGQQAFATQGLGVLSELIGQRPASTLGLLSNMYSQGRQADFQTMANMLGIGQNQLGFMERREDAYTQQNAQRMQALGSMFGALGGLGGLGGAGTSMPTPMGSASYGVY